MSQTFWISTGDIREAYETVNVVAVERTFSSGGIYREFRAAVDALAVQAQQLGANGVIWIRVERILPGMLGGEICIVTGTAVRVRPASS